MHHKTLNIAKNQKHDVYQCGLPLMVYKVFDKKKLLVEQLKMKMYTETKSSGERVKVELDSHNYAT